MDLTQKFDRGDPNAKGGKRKRRKKDDEEQWKGSEDVEKLSAIFMAYQTSPSNFNKGAAGEGDESPATMTNAERAAAETSQAQ